MIQRHHISNGAQGYKIQQFSQIGGNYTQTIEPAGFAQPLPKRNQHVKHDPDAGQILARKTVSVDIRVYNDIRIRQF